MEMEAVLKQILERLTLIEEGQTGMRKDLNDVKLDQAGMRKDLNDVKLEQSEMRKEVAFYYGSMMKKLDETKSELSSEIKHFTSIQKQHQDVLELLNQKQ
jgi:septation ring formation regulator EzrA